MNDDEYSHVTVSQASSASSKVSLTLDELNEVCDCLMAALGAKGVEGGYVTFDSLLALTLEHPLLALTLTSELYCGPGQDIQHACKSVRFEPQLDQLTYQRRSLELHLTC